MEKKAEIYSIASQKMTQYMESHAMRKTPERYEILKTVCQIKGIFSVDKLQEEMQSKAHFQVSRATLFNTLELLVKAQLVVRHTLQRCFLYETCITSKPLVCQVCSVCEGVSKVDDEEITASLEAIRVKQFSIQQPVLYLHGICKKCSAARNKKKKQKNIT